MEGSDHAAADNKFEKLRTFDFKNNKVFQDGWRKIRAVVRAEVMFDSFIKAQVFFFSREVEPVNFEEYRSWLEKQRIDAKEYLDNHMPDSDVDMPGSNIVEVKDDSSVDMPKSNATEVKETDTVTSAQESAYVRAGKHPESFAELVEMIQAGLKLPEAEGPEIEPINDDPTPPVVERRKKPWENS